MMLRRWSRAISVSSGTGPMRILGPCRSPMMAMGLPVWAWARRTESTAWVHVLSSPWEKLMRATSSPALTSARTVSGSLEAGPRVATILARRRAVMVSGYWSGRRRQAQGPSRRAFLRSMGGFEGMAPSHGREKGMGVGAGIVGVCSRLGRGGDCSGGRLGRFLFRFVRFCSVLCGFGAALCAVARDWSWVVRRWGAPPLSLRDISPRGGELGRGRDISPRGGELGRGRGISPRGGELGRGRDISPRGGEVGSGAEEGFEEVVEVLVGVQVAGFEQGAEDFFDLRVVLVEVAEFVLADAALALLLAVVDLVEGVEQESEFAGGGDVFRVDVGVGLVESLDDVEELVGGEVVDDLVAMALEFAQVASDGGGRAVHLARRPVGG